MLKNLLKISFVFTVLASTAISCNSNDAIDSDSGSGGSGSGKGSRTNLDSDGDGVSDYLEAIYGTNPKLKDSPINGDYKNDKDYILAKAVDLLKEKGIVDEDGDGVPDALEASFDLDDEKKDTDNDGEGDLSELLNGTTAALEKTEKDGKALDLDKDGVPDYLEPLFGLDPTNPTTIGTTPDLDTFLKKLKDSKAGFSIDTDGDGIPDIIEDKYDFLDKNLINSKEKVDADGNDLDGYDHDMEEYLAYLARKGQKDFNELYLKDSDRDGLSDGYEIDHESDKNSKDYLNPNSADTDGDGFPDGVEIAYGTYPNDASSYPSIGGGGGSGAYEGQSTILIDGSDAYYNILIAGFGLGDNMYLSDNSDDDELGLVADSANELVIPAKGAGAYDFFVSAWFRQIGLATVSITKVIPLRLRKFTGKEKEGRIIGEGSFNYNFSVSIFTDSKQTTFKTPKVELLVGDVIRLSLEPYLGFINNGLTLDLMVGSIQGNAGKGINGFLGSYIIARKYNKKK